MTEEQTAEFAVRFAREYDLPGAARAAGVSRAEAYAALAEPAVRARVDAAVAARASGDTLSRIRREYEEIAFGGDAEVRVADRIRALEQLRLIAAADAGSVPALTLRVEYV